MRIPRLHPSFLVLLSMGLAPIAAAAEPAGPCLWKVSAGDDDSKSLYLAGSVHLLREEDHPLPGVFETAYAASELLVLEIASAAEDGAEIEGLQRGLQKEGKTIRDDLSKDGYQRLRRYLGDNELPANSMDGFRPWLAAMSVSITETMKHGGRPELGVDAFFEARALQDGKPVHGLETSEFQIGLFADLDRDSQEVMLLSTLEDMEEIEREYPRMVDAWRAGDETEMGRMMLDATDDLPELRRAVLDDRNRDWVGKLEKFIKGERDAMVIVGVAHLIGPGSVVSLLRERGYTVERLSAKKPRFIRVLAPAVLGVPGV